MTDIRLETKLDSENISLIKKKEKSQQQEVWTLKAVKQQVQWIKWMKVNYWKRQKMLRLHINILSPIYKLNKGQTNKTWRCMFYIWKQ